MRRNIIVLFVMLAATNASAQLSSGIKNIENLCGCFDVEFKYAETFAPDDEYEYHNRERISHARELVVVAEQKNKKLVLQHLLVVEDTVVIKHWREDWLFEHPVLFKYTGENTWQKQVLNAQQVKNKWTQTVWEVSDAPRYQGTSEWITTDNKTFWMNTADAPLPRREYTKRKDYNVLKRRNIIVSAATGWIHEQDNEKIIRANGTDTLLAEEKGINSYKRVDENKCAAAKIYWEKNKAFWNKVRLAWEKFMEGHDTVSVKPSVNGKPMYMLLSELEEEYGAKKISDQEIGVKIEEAIQLYTAQ